MAEVPERPGDRHAVDLEEFLERQPVSRLQAGVTVLALLVMILDGVDLQILGLAAPRIVHDWGISKAALGPALAMTVVGMGFGAIGGGWFGDRWGRKPTMIVALVLIGLSSVACFWVSNVAELALCRFACGVGGGACFPASAALIADWLPRRRKSLAVGLTTVGIPIGGMVGAALVIATLDRGGWREAFLLGGVLPLVLAAAAAALMAESPAWTTARRHDSGATAILLARAFPSTPMPAGGFTVTPPRAAHGRVGIFGPDDRRTTLGIWLAFYMNVLATSGIVTWGTTLLTTLGFAMALAVSIVFAVNLVSAATMVACSVLTLRFGSRTLFLFASSSAVAALAIVASIAAGTPTSRGVAVGLVVAGGVLFMNQTLLYIIASQAYPIEKRSTGVGLGSLVSRFGSTTSALFGGVVLSLGSPLWFIAALAVAALLAGIGALIVDRHVAPMRAPTSRRLAP